MMNEQLPADGTAAQGVFRVNADARIAFVDEQTARMLGYAPDELIGRRFTELFFESELTQARHNFDQRRLGIGGVTEYPLRRKDGSPVWVAVASAPTLDAGGAFLGVTGFVTDIDAHHRRESLSAHERRLLRMIAGNYPLASVLEDLCLTLEAVSRRPLRATVMLAAGDSLRCVAAPSLPPDFRGNATATGLKDSGTACAEAVRSGRKVVVGDTARADISPDIAACRVTYGFGAIWSYPIEQDAEILGTLALLLPAAGEPDAEDEQAIEFAIQVARLALARERDARSRDESEQRLRDFAELSADWFWEQDADFRFTEMSGGAFNKGGFRVADSMGKTRWELPVEGIDAAQWAAHRALLERHEVFRDFTYSIRVADGTLHWYSVSGQPVFGPDGEFLGYRGIGSDISERKCSEAALIISEQRFRDYAAMSADWFWEQDAEFRFTGVSYGAGIRPMTPHFYSRQSVGRHRWDLPYVNVPEGFWEEHRRLLEAGRPFSNLRLQRRDGESVRHVEISGRPLFDDQGRVIGYRGTGRDITEQVNSREQLDKALRWLEQAIRAAGIGLWERDIDTWTFSFKDNWRALFGYAENEIKNTTEDFDRLVHPDDLARIHAAGRAYAANPQREYEIRFRIRHKNGSWRWVLSRGNVMNELVTGRRTFVGCHLDITEQMHTAQVLQASELRLRDFAELSADWFWEQDAELRFTAISSGSGYASPTAQYLPSETIGKRRWELPYIDAPEGFWDAHRRLLAAHQPFADLHLDYRNPDGTLHHAVISGKPVFDDAGEFAGYRGTGRDITAQVAARDKLEKTRRWLEQAVRAANIGLWERDVDSWIFDFGGNWKAQFGYAEDEIGDAFADFDSMVHPDDLARIRAFVRAYEKDPRGDYENRFRIRHKDGSWRWVLSRGRILTDAATGRRTWMGCHIDITDQWRAENRVRELAATLETRVKARTAELEEANRELDAFNFSVAHDLRTPLRAIEGFSQALLEDYHAGLDATGRDYLQRIGAATARMGELIEALHELSRLLRAPLRLRPVDLSAMARELVAELRAHEPARSVEFEIEETPPAEGDPRLLRIVLANLLSNAWKFTARAAPARIAFGARTDELGRIEYCVRDNGTGFDMQFADKLFLMFHRLHREHEFPGQGIGLATAQRIVARHGGSIRGDGQPGAGASFCFTLWEAPALLAEAREAVDAT